MDETSTESESESDEMTMTDRSDWGDGAIGLLVVGFNRVGSWGWGFDDVEVLVGLVGVKENLGRPEPKAELRADRGVQTFLEKSTSGGRESDCLVAEDGPWQGEESGLNDGPSTGGVFGGIQDGWCSGRLGGVVVLDLVPVRAGRDSYICCFKNEEDS